MEIPEKILNKYFIYGKSVPGIRNKSSVKNEQASQKRFLKSLTRKVIN